MTLIPTVILGDNWYYNTRPRADASPPGMALALRPAYLARMQIGRFMGTTARYAIIGGVCAGLNNAAVIGGAALGIDYVTTSVAAFLVVTPLAYALHTSISFRGSPSLVGLLRYSAGLATALPLFLACMFVFSTLFAIPVAIASPVSTVLLILWNYALAHWSISGFGRPQTPP